MRIRANQVSARYAENSAVLGRNRLSTFTGVLENDPWAYDRFLASGMQERSQKLFVPKFERCYDQGVHSGLRLVPDPHPLLEERYSSLFYTIFPLVERHLSTVEGLVCMYPNLQMVHGVPTTSSSRLAWQLAMIRLSSQYGSFCASADIRMMFPTMDLHLLTRQLREFRVSEVIIAELCEVLELMGSRIPITHMTSDLLSRVAMFWVDQEILRCGLNIVRWQDDFRIFGRDREDVTRQLRTLRILLHGIGFSLNAQKTFVHTPEALPFILRDITPNRTEVWNYLDPADIGDRLLDGPGYPPSWSSRAGSYEATDRLLALKHDRIDPQTENHSADVERFVVRRLLSDLSPDDFIAEYGLTLVNRPHITAGLSNGWAGRDESICDELFSAAENTHLTSVKLSLLERHGRFDERTSSLISTVVPSSRTEADRMLNVCAQSFPVPIGYVGETLQRDPWPQALASAAVLTESEFGTRRSRLRGMLRKTTSGSIALAVAEQLVA